MSIIQKLWWFFKLEKRRYLVGIVALVLVSVLNLIPPMVMGRVIDAITSGRLTQDELLLHLFYLLLAAFGMYYLRYVLAHVYPRNLLPTWTNHAFKTI